VTYQDKWKIYLNPKI